jgi:hypothetical protein
VIEAFEASEAFEAKEAIEAAELSEIQAFAVTYSHKYQKGCHQGDSLKKLINQVFQRGRLHLKCHRE